VGFVYVGDESTAYTANFIKAENAVKDNYGDSVIIEENIMFGKQSWKHLY
jgi:hypothetical protein